MSTNDTTAAGPLTARHAAGKVARVRMHVLAMAIASGCTNAQVDIETGQEPGDGPSSTTMEPPSGVTGDEPIGTTTGLGESNTGGSTEAHDSSGAATSEGSDTSSTGEPTDCPLGTTGMEDGRCLCDLGNGEKRAIDPVECGCELTWGPMGGDCQCDGVDFPLVSCGWECTDITGECQCGGIDAPVTWCGGDPVLCEGDIEIDTNAPLEACVCVSSHGLPPVALDPVHCGCVPVADGCECDGITYEPWVCGWPCTTQEDLSCICGALPAPQSACALP